MSVRFHCTALRVTINTRMKEGGRSMQTQKEKITLCILIVSFVCHPSTSIGQSSPCNVVNSERLATAYALAFFYPDHFVSYVQQERATLSSSPFRRCIEAVRNAYSAAGINHPSSQEVYARSMDVASRAGAPELGPQVADSTTRTQGNPAVVGIVLDQLSKVLAGELPYEFTLMYQDARQRQVLEEACRMSGGEALIPGGCSANTRIMFEVARWYMEFVARAVQ